MGLETGALPRALHKRMTTELESLRQLARAPVGRAVGRRFAGPRENPRLERRRQDGGGVAPIAPLQAGDARLKKAPFPFPNGSRALAQATLDVEVRRPISQMQDDLRAPRKIGASAARSRQRLQGASLLDRQHNRRLGRLWHAPLYHVTTV